MSRGYTESEKAKILSDLSRSGLSVTAFSRRSGLAVSTLCKWRKQSGSAVGKDFIELTGERHYELEVGRVKLRIPVSASVERVSELVKALSTC